MKTKPYLTLRDRLWKGKEWYTSFRSMKNIRKLTDEEAKPFLEDETIVEYIPPKYGKDIVGDDNGTMVCNVCGSRKGFYVKSYPFGKPIRVYTCSECKIREVKKIS